MIGRKHSEEIRALQEMAVDHAARLDALMPQIEAVHARLETLSLQINAISSQFAAEQERLAEEAARVTHCEHRLDEAEHIATVHAQAIGTQDATLVTQTETLKSQAHELDFLRNQAERQDEAVREVHGALTRIDRQAAIDLDEMRRTSAAVARAVFLREPGQRITPIEDQDGNRGGSD